MGGHRLQRPQVEGLRVDLRPHVAVAGGAGDVDHVRHRREVVGAGLGRGPIVGAKAGRRAAVPEILLPAPHGDDDEQAHRLVQRIGSDAALVDLRGRADHGLARVIERTGRAVVVRHIPLAEIGMPPDQKAELKVSARLVTSAAGEESRR